MLTFLISTMLSFATETFTNPMYSVGPDPWVYQKDGWYYYMVTTGGEVIIHKSQNLHDVAKSKGITVWSAPGNSPFNYHIWAPELHYLDGKWYIYTCGNRNNSFENHESFVLEGTSQNPQDPFVYKATLAPDIDGTVLIGDDGEKYFIWSHYVSDQRIYISKMSNPWTLTGDYVELSRGIYDWEKRPYALNEAPQILKKGNKTMIIYSASASWTEDYCLGMLSNTDGNFMNPDSWTKCSTPVFEKSPENSVYGVGHCSFVKSPDYTEDWIIYHGMVNPNGGWSGRSPRMQKFTWNSDNTPNFGIPVKLGVPIPIPSNIQKSESNITGVSVVLIIIGLGLIGILLLLRHAK